MKQMTRLTMKFSPTSCMLRTLKSLLLVAMLGTMGHRALGFALIGPNNEAYQIPDLGFNPNDYDGLPTAPKNLGQEYRRTTPVLYYAYDANFLEYFGSNGVGAVEQAIGIMNNLTNVSQFSADLSEFPQAAHRENYQAEALFLRDLKSETLHLLIEQLGLAEPERYIWVLHDRYIVATPPGCPGAMEYLLVQRNFDPFTFVPSSYVNGTLYSFIILEFCATPVPINPIIADAAEFSVDPLADAFSAVAGNGDMWGIDLDSGLIVGRFYTGITRDDAAGLRYLIHTNTVNYEAAPAGATIFVTNGVSPTPLQTFNLGQLLSLAPTNTAAQLQAIFPGLIDTSTQIGFEVATNLNVSLVVTSSPFAPAGYLTTVFVTNPPTYSFLPVYTHTFDNVVTNWYSPNSTITIQTVSAKGSAFGYPGVTRTNTSSKTVVLTNVPSGEFYVVPAGLCGVTLLTNLLDFKLVTAITNIITFTNSTVITNNTAGASNFVGTISQSTISYFTNHAIAYLPLTCPDAPVELRQGVDRIQFVRANYDSLVGRFFQPLTNTYTTFAVSNNTIIPQVTQRIIAAPDILFTAADLDSSGDNTIPAAGYEARSINFNAANAGAGNAGPGTIDPATTITFNNAGPTYLNDIPNNYFITEAANQLEMIWGSFDGSTNPPVAYPDSVSILNLQNQIVIQPSPAPPNLLAATNGVAYTLQFSATGGQPPYTWSSPELQSLGFGFGAGGLVSGAPTTNGTFDVSVQLTDSDNRTVSWPYTITIYP